MAKHRSRIILFLVILAVVCSAQEKPGEERLRNIIKSKGQAEVVIPYPDKVSLNELTRNVSIRAARDKKIYIVLSPLTVDWFLASGHKFDILEYPYGKYFLGSANMREAMEWESYPTLPQYDSIIKSFADNYPSLCRLDTIGTSIKGRIIYAVRISSDSTGNKDLPRVFITSSIHGDETGGYVLLLRLADYLLKNYAPGSMTGVLLDSLEIWINPLANPDGTYNFGDVITTPVRHNADGYDLNRNFPDPSAPATVRQKETLDMIRFMRKQRFVLSANLHSGSEVVNYPWDRWERYHADNNWFCQISRKYADTVHYYSIPGYMNDLDNGITNGYAWYSIYGGRQDFVTYELQGREVTIEIDDDYITPPAGLSDLWEYNYRSLLGFFENALYGIHGTTADYKSGKPVPAKLFIKGHDRDSSHIFSDTLSGSFIRLLEPGVWDVSFSARGYRDTVIRDILVNDGERTTLSVRMKKESDISDEKNINDIILYPNPSLSFVNVVLPEKMTGTVNIRIVSHTGTLLGDYETEVFDRVPVIIDTGGFPPGSYSVVFMSLKTGVTVSGRFIKAGGS